MASLPPFRQLQFNQLPGAPTWFAPFLQALNTYLSAVYDMANKGTTFGDNIPSQVKALTVITDDAGAFAAQSLACTLKARPVAVMLAQAQLVRGTAGTAAISLNQWSYVAGKIQLDSIVGLAPSATYTLTFLVI